MIYEKAMGKIRRKFCLYGPALRKMSVQRRIITINVFILSLLSYVNQLVRMPDTAYADLRNLIHKHATPWNGTAWGYNLLVIPCRYGGFPTPINDPWVTNVSALLRRVDWNSVNISSISWEPSFVDSQDARVSGIWEGSVRFSDNINLAIVDFLGPLYYNWDKVSSLSSLSKSEIKHSLIKNGFLNYPRMNKTELTCGWGRDYDSYLSTRLEHFGVAQHVGELKKHYSKPVKNSYLYENHLKILTNSLATSRRRRVLPSAGLGSSSLPTCRLCQTGDDGVKHLFFHCKVVKDAMAMVARSNILALPAPVRSALLDNQRPLFLPISVDFATVKFSPLFLCMAFCRAVTNATDRVGAGVDINPAASFILNATIRYVMPNTDLSMRRFGNACKRTAEQKKMANEYAIGVISKIPASSTIIYTDGSAVPNPGPAGSGCFIQHPDSLHLPHVYLYASIGVGTNNLGEAWAIGMALTHFYAHDPTVTCVILTDSELCIRAIKNGFSNHPPLNCLIQRILSLPRDHPDHYVKLFWVPGHVDVAGKRNG
jgi:ribonuclease HI